MILLPFRWRRVHHHPLLVVAAQGHRRETAGDDVRGVDVSHVEVLGLRGAVAVV